MSFMNVMTPDLGMVFDILGAPMTPLVFEQEKKMHYFTI